MTQSALYTTTSEPVYLQSLNPAQRAAVEALDGPVLVLAGAGTGKTRVLTARLIHLLATHKALPAQILAVTFTNKAAGEVRGRVAEMLGRSVEGWYLGTFHALAARLLRPHAELVGLKPSFTILDDDDQTRLIKQILEAENIDVKRSPPRAVLAVINRWKDRGLLPRDVAHEKSPFADGKTPKIYAAYQQRLLELNACDFGDLLLHHLTILRAHPDILAELHNRFRYILVDEYQDTNTAQYLWLRLLAQARKNICCVGDEDQSIYGWRGAEVGNILRFEEDFPGAAVVRLEQNYRSTGHILAAASSVIANNQMRLGKTLWTSADMGDPVRVQSLWDGEEEARWVSDEIEDQQRKGVSLNNMAVMVRAGFQTRAFEERFIQLGLPYRVLVGARFYERAEIRDALAYLRLLVTPEDDLAFERIINVPKRGVGPAALQQLYSYARGREAPLPPLGVRGDGESVVITSHTPPHPNPLPPSGGRGNPERISLMESAARLVESDELKPKLRQTLRGLVENFARWRGLLQTLPHTEVAQIVLDDSGYTGMWQADKSPEAPGRLDNLKELIGALAEFDTLPAFLEHVSLVMEATGNTTGEQVSLMTLHGAKGLEFDFVFLPGWEEEIFPSRRSIDENGAAGLEEERRLAYVGITRARKRASISHVARRLLYGNWVTPVPSRFLEELPDEHVLRHSTIGNGIGAGFRLGASGESGERKERIPPLWQQLQAGQGGGRRVNPIEIEGRATVIQPPRDPNALQIGDRVTHEKFGSGIVRRVEGGKLEVMFERKGVLKVMAGFVRKG
ncbi:MAG: UvrD-helicase domain-containing protein [Alphaproteobacteria bacterium]|nr:UvrD-helicase domain-containing protein [Alphaproteobacteria bacterium]